MAGFGQTPFGLTPFGIGTPADAPGQPTGPAGCRYINPATKDYQVNPATRQFAQMPALRQRVLLALSTDYASITVNQTFGLKKPRKMGDTFVAEMKAWVRAALKHLTDVEKVMSLDAVIVERGSGGRSRTTVVFTDLATGAQDTATTTS